MKISVLMAAYGKPDHLRKALTGYAIQNDKNYEIIVSEDGEMPENRKVIEAVASNSKVPIQHLTQSDDGFRKSVAINSAIEAATGDYLIFSDDDCIPRKDVVSTHRQYCQQGQYIVGAYNRLPSHITETIRTEDIISQRVFSLSWLFRNGFIPTRGFTRIIAPKWLGSLLDLRGPLDPGRFPGGHSSCFRNDAIEVGGFNEDMAYGLEDREFGTRLCNLGIVGKRVKNSTFVYHLDHERPYMDMEKFEENRLILEETVRTKRIRSAHLDGSAN
ncbi:MAG: glycosyltransferase [Pseudomonadota bacterium]